MRCLVTGGAGFLGSHLVDRLVAGGHDVVAVDDFYTGDRQNVAHLRDARFELVAHDVREPLPVLGGAFERIYNLACPASPPQYQKDPVFTLQTSLLGAIHVLERAARDGARVMHASTSEVYGDPEVHPQTESYWGHVNPIGPRACYDEGKRAAEALCVAYRDSRGVDVRLARIFNTYGPRMNAEDGRVVSNFVVQALRGEPLTVYGDGGQTRSFCYVSDLVDGFVRLCEHPEPIGPVNLGNPGEFTIEELAREVLSLTCSRSELVREPLPKDDPQRRRPDITLARERLGFEPKIALREGLGATVEHFRRTLADQQSARTRP